MLPLTFVCRSLCGRMFSFLWGIYLGVGLLGHMVTSFDHLRNAGLLYQLHFCQQRRRVPLSPRACRTVDVVPLFDCSPPNRCRVALHCSFDFHFLDGWGGEHLFMCFLATCVYFLRFIFIRERERCGGRETEKHDWLHSAHAPTGDRARNPGMCPDRESNQQPFGYWTMLQPTEPHWPGLYIFFGYLFRYSAHFLTGLFFKLLSCN